MNANLTYETINGAYTIVLSFMVVFLVRYLYEIWRITGWRAFVFDRNKPETMALQLAVAILIADGGNLILRASTGLWRVLGGDLSKLGPVTAFIILLSAVMGATGIMCKLRVVSIVRYGHWPWVTCLIAVVVFVVFWLGVASDA